MVKIIGMEVYDWRFPTSIQSDGSDAVHKDPDVRDPLPTGPLAATALEHCKRQQPRSGPLRRAR